MQFDTQVSVTYVARNLKNLLERAMRDTVEVIEKGNIPDAVVYYAELTAAIAELKQDMSTLQKHMDGISQELLPTMFQNQRTKTIKVEGVGRVTINDRWSCSMLKPDEAIEFLRQTNNEGMIKETVHPMTLGAHAKDEHLAGRPLPSALFKVSSTPYTSITKA